MMEDEPVNDYKALSILARAMIMGIVMFSAISILLFYMRGRFVLDTSAGNTVFVILLVTGAVTIMVSGKIYEKRLATLKESSMSRSKKLVSFRSSLIIQLAICEVIAILAIICFILFGQFFFFLIVLMMLAEMIRRIPRKEKIESLIY